MLISRILIFEKKNYSRICQSRPTYFCEYGKYFLIGYNFSEIENLLLLAERAKENVRFEIVLIG